MSKRMNTFKEEEEKEEEKEEGKEEGKEKDFISPPHKKRKITPYQSKWQDGWPISIKKLMIHSIYDEKSSFLGHCITGFCSHDGDIMTNVCQKWMELIQPLDLMCVNNACTCSCLQNSIKRLCNAHRNGITIDKTTIAAAAFFDAIDCLAYCTRHSDERDHMVCACAAMTNSICSFIYAIKNGYSMSEYAVVAAAAFDSIDCLRYMYEHLHIVVTCPYDIIIEVIIHQRSFRCLSYIHNHGYVYNYKTLKFAAQTGSLRLFKHIHSSIPTNAYTKPNGIINKSVCSRIIISGPVKCLIYAHTNGYTCDGWDCFIAAVMGRKDILQYLHEHGCTWSITRGEQKRRSSTIIGRLMAALDRLERRKRDILDMNQWCLNYAQCNGCLWDGKRTKINRLWKSFEKSVNQRDAHCQHVRDCCCDVLSHNDTIF